MMHASVGIKVYVLEAASQMIASPRVLLQDFNLQREIDFLLLRDDTGFSFALFEIGLAAPTLDLGSSAFKV